MKKNVLNPFTGEFDIIDIQTEFYNNLASFPVTGVVNIIYTDKATGNLYIWNGSAYIDAGNKNIYNSNGTLTANRTVELSNRTLFFNTLTNGGVIFNCANPSNNAESLFGIGSNGLDFSSKDTSTNTISSMSFSKFLTTIGFQNSVASTYFQFDAVNGLTLVDDMKSRGIEGTAYWAANYTDNTYVQKKYVDDAIALIPANTLQTVTNNGNTSTNEIVILNNIGELIRLMINGNEGQLIIQNDTVSNSVQIAPDNIRFNTTTGSLGIQPTISSSANVQTLQDATGVIALLSDIVAATPEQIQDAAFAILIDTATIDLNYNDVANTVTATVIDNSITNAKLAQMPALTVIGNQFVTMQNAQYLPLKEVLIGTSFLQAGTRTITDVRITTTSNISFSPTNVGFLTGVPIRVTKNVGSVVFNTGQTGDSAEFDYKIIF